MRADQVTDPIAYHGEGPVWSPRWGGLRWVDMLAGDILALRDGEITRTHVADVAAAVRPRRGGGAVIGVTRGFALENGDGTVHALTDLWSDTNIRMNEGACDPDGRFYCGSMAYDTELGAGSLYRLDPDGSVEVVLTDVTISNGLDWSPDGRTAYFIDTQTSRIDRFDYDAASGLTNRRLFVDVSGPGKPDGLNVDAEGGVWVALYDGGTVRRYSATGQLDQVVEVAARKVTACTLGGERLDELFITTSREGLEPEDDPLAGALFSIRVSIPGQPIREFAG